MFTFSIGIQHFLLHKTFYKTMRDSLGAHFPCEIWNILWGTCYRDVINGSFAHLEGDKDWISSRVSYRAERRRLPLIFPSAAIRIISNISSVAVNVLLNQTSLRHCFRFLISLLLYTTDKCNWAVHCTHHIECSSLIAPAAIRGW